MAGVAAAGAGAPHTQRTRAPPSAPPHTPHQQTSELPPDSPDVSIPPVTKHDYVIHNIKQGTGGPTLKVSDWETYSK